MNTLSTRNLGTASDGDTSSNKRPKITWHGLTPETEPAAYNRCSSCSVCNAIFEDETPSNFCDFLIQSGKRTKAEQVALAVVGKTQGSAESVRYVLKELVPHSQDGARLVQEVKHLLQNAPKSPICDEGKNTFLKWYLQNNSNTEDAFFLAMQITYETIRVKQCLLLLNGDADRRQKLLVSSPYICQSEMLQKVFQETEWPVFLTAMQHELPNIYWHPGYSGLSTWSPKLEIVIQYAVQSMSREAGKRAATSAIEYWLERAIWSHMNWNYLPGPSQVRSAEAANDEIRKGVPQVMEEVEKLITTFQKEVLSTSEISEGLNNLSIDPMVSLQKAIAGVYGGIQPSLCRTSHYELHASYKCPRCRETFEKSLKTIGTLAGIRQHSLTRHHPLFKAMNLDSHSDSVIYVWNKEMDAKAVLLQAGIYPRAVAAMFSGMRQELVACLTAGAATSLPEPVVSRHATP